MCAVRGSGGHWSQRHLQPRFELQCFSCRDISGGWSFKVFEVFWGLYINWLKYRECLTCIQVQPKWFDMTWTLPMWPNCNCFGKVVPSWRHTLVLALVSNKRPKSCGVCSVLPISGDWLNLYMVRKQRCVLEKSYDFAHIKRTKLWVNQDSLAAAVAACGATWDRFKTCLSPACSLLLARLLASHTLKHELHLFLMTGTKQWHGSRSSWKLWTYIVETEPS